MGHDADSMLNGRWCGWVAAHCIGWFLAGAVLSVRCGVDPCLLLCSSDITLRSSPQHGFGGVGSMCCVHEPRDLSTHHSCQLTLLCSLLQQLLSIGTVAAMCSAVLCCTAVCCAVLCMAPVCAHHLDTSTSHHTACNQGSSSRCSSSSHSSRVSTDNQGLQAYFK